MFGPAKETGGGTRRGPEGYKFAVLPGNNSRLIMSCFRERPWWHTLSPTSEDGHGADLIWEMYRNPTRYRGQKKQSPDHFVQADTCCLNHFEMDSVLVTKHGLYWSLRRLYEGRGLPLPPYLPETYHVVPDVETDPLKAAEWARFEAAFASHADAARAALTLPAIGRALTLPAIGRAGARGASEPEEPDESGARDGANEKAGGGKATNVWIAKPAALSNRGMGISVISQIAQVSKLLDSPKKRTRAGYIVQKYIERPLLVGGRKFDIRVYLLLVADPSTGKLRAYHYRDGYIVLLRVYPRRYIRTSSVAYSLTKKSLKNKFIHLTNDGIQKQDGATYGKFEAGNKMSYDEFQSYLDAHHPGRTGWVRGEMVPEMTVALVDCAAAAETSINPRRRRNCFELLGVDFMVTSDFKLMLIEVNSNPCLEFSSPYLEALLPKVLEACFQRSVDVLRPPPTATTKAAAAAVASLAAAENCFDLIYAEA